MSATFSTQKQRGKPFVKGMKKVGGRKPGVPNLATRAVREMISAAAAGLGGTARLIEWAKESELNERLFWTTIWPRLLPLQVQGTGEHGELELNVKLSAEEFAQRLAERGLPTVVFGSDKPVLELEPRRIAGNGGRCDGEVEPPPMSDPPEGMRRAGDSESDPLEAGDSESDPLDRDFLEARMRRHVDRYGGRT